MKKMGICLQGLTSAVLAAIYIFFVALFMYKGETIFDGDSSLWIPFIMLTLFTLSAAVMGALILGRPVMMYIDGKKKEAVKLLGCTIGWIFVIMIVIAATKILF